MATEKVTIPLAHYHWLNGRDIEAIRLEEKIVALEKQIEDLKSSLSFQKGVTKTIAEKTISLIN